METFYVNELKTLIVDYDNFGDQTIRLRVESLLGSSYTPFIETNQEGSHKTITAKYLKLLDERY